MEEVFKPLRWKNFKPYYLISNTGKVKNKITGAYLEPFISNSGYFRVHLRTKENKSGKESLHVLVFVTFGDPKDVKIYRKNIGKRKYAVNHKDGIKTNCNIENLELTTYRENNIHAVVNGLSPSGENSYRSKVTDEFVDYICTLMDEGNSNKQILKMLKVSNDKYMKKLINNIRAGAAWNNISSKHPFVKKSTRKWHDSTLLHNICKMIDYGHSTSEMLRILNIMRKEDRDDFSKLVYTIKNRVAHRDISENYNWWKNNGSTTIEPNKYGYILFNIKAPYGRINS